MACHRATCDVSGNVLRRENSLGAAIWMSGNQFNIQSAIDDFICYALGPEQDQTI
jgi:hypothetical protein